MANTFKQQASRAVGTSNTQVGSYTVAAATTAVLIGLTCANITAAAVTVTVQSFDGTNYTNLVYQAPIPVGGTLVLSDQLKTILPTGYSIYVQSSVASSVDVMLSVLEIS